MVNNSNIFTYWEGPKQDHIEICLNTIRKFGGIVITPETLHEYCDVSVIHESYKNLKKIAERVDCLRAAIIHQNGGWWIDADTALLASPSMLTTQNNSDFLASYYGLPLIRSGFFYARKNSAFVEKWLELNNDILAKHTAGIRFGTFGTFNLTKVSKICQWDQFDGSLVSPFKVAEMDETWRSKITPDTVAIHIHNSSMKTDNIHFQQMMKELDKPIVL